MVAQLSNEYLNGNKFVGMAKLSAMDGSIISLVNPSVEVTHGSQIISHTSTRNSAGGFVNVGTRNGSVSLIAFDSCLENDCLESEDYILTPLSVNVASVNLSQVIPTDPVPSSPLSQSVNLTITPGACLTCTDVITVNLEDFCIGIPGMIEPFLNGFELEEASAVSWTFSNGDASTELNPTLIFQSAGIISYSLDITTLNGCAYTFNGTIEVLDVPPVPDIPAELQFCEGESATLDFSVFSEFVEILDTEGNQVSGFFTFSNPGTYTFSFISPCTTYVETVDVQLFEIPALLPMFPSDFCADEIIQFSILNWASIAGVADLNINLGNGESFQVTNPSIQTAYAAPGSYTVEVSGTISGCEVNQSTQLTIVAPLNFELPNALSFCTSESITVEFANLGFPVQNSAGQTIASFSTSTAGTYIFTAQNACGVVSYALTVNEVVFSPEPFNLNAQLCPMSDTLEIGFKEDSFLYQWSTGTDSHVILVSEAGNYSAVVSDATGTCSLDFLFVVSAIEPNSTLIFPEPDITLCEEGSRTVTPPFVGVPYTFSDGTSGYNFYVGQSGVFTASYSDFCYTYQEQLSVSIEPCLCPVFVPNVFSPNSDGINDIFKATADCPLLEFRMVIFNRWGREVFESKDINFGWNGSSPNRDFYGSDGVYYYLIYYGQTLDGVFFPGELAGHVTLLK